MDAYLIVDPDSRNITIPEIESAFGVYGDNNAERKYFKSPRIVGNGIDLTECYLYVNYISASTKIGQILCDVGDAPNGTATEDEIIFSWPITRNVLDKNVSGEIFFAVQAKTKTGDTVFTTRKAKGNCYESIEGTEAVAEEYADIVLQLISRMDNVEANIGEQVAAYFKENPAVTAEYLDQTLQPVKDSVSQIKENIGDIVTVKNTNVINITNAAKGEKNGISYELSKDGMLTINGECTTNTALDLSNTISSTEHNGKIFIGAKFDSGKPPQNQQYLLVQGLLDNNYTRLFTIGYSDFESDSKIAYEEKQVANRAWPYSITIFAGSYDNVKFQLFVNKDKFTYDKDGVYLNSNVNTDAVEKRLKTWTDDKYEKLLTEDVKVKEKVNLLNASDNFETTVNGISIKYSNGVATLSGTASARTSFTIAKNKSDIASGIAYIGYVINSGSTTSKIIWSGLVDETYKDIITHSSPIKANIVYRRIECSSMYPYNLSILQGTVLDNYKISFFINDSKLMGVDYYTLNSSIRIDSQEDNIFDNIIDSLYFDSIIHCISKNTIQNVTDFSHTNLYEKKVAFVGDSFTDKNTSLYENGKSYIYYQKDIFNLTVQNLGISGSTISSYAKSSNPMVLRLSNIESDADMIVLRGGVNDFLAHTPIGLRDSNNSDDFCGALNNSIKYLKENYSSAKLAFITPIYCDNSKTPNKNNFILEDYVKAMMEVCRRNKVKCYDGYHFGICNEITSKLYLKDGLHYNADGNESEKLIIASFLSSAFNQRGL